MPSPRFSLALRAQLTDVDELGHVSNLVYLRWVQEIAKAHSVSVGWDHARYQSEGGVFVVRRHVLDYLAPTFAGDELRVETWIEKWSAVTCERHTRVLRVADERELATCVTTWVYVAIASGAPRRVPKEIITLFGAA